MQFYAATKLVYDEWSKIKIKNEFISEFKKNSFPRRSTSTYIFEFCTKVSNI